MEVGLIDNQTMPNAPTSRFLTKEEMFDIDRDWIWHRKSFIFKHQIPLVVDRKVADVLVGKYDSINFYDRKDNLRAMKYLDLKKMAKSKGLSHKETMVNRELLIDAIDKVNG
jgi:hypothetical protein